LTYPELINLKRTKIICPPIILTAKGPPITKNLKSTQFKALCKEEYKLLEINLTTFKVIAQFKMRLVQKLLIVLKGIQ